MAIEILVAKAILQYLNFFLEIIRPAYCYHTYCDNNVNPHNIIVCFNGFLQMEFQIYK